MRNERLLAATAAVGLVIGGILFNAQCRRAMPCSELADVVDRSPAFTVIGHPGADRHHDRSVSNRKAVTNIGELRSSDQLTNVGNLLNDKLTSGFTQQSNYAKAQPLGAQEQIADASNTVPWRPTRKTSATPQLRDEHTLSRPKPASRSTCGQAITVSAGQSWRVGQALSQGHRSARRGRTGHPGLCRRRARRAAAITQLHLSRYCSQNEALTRVSAPSTPARREPRPEVVQPVRCAFNYDRAGRGRCRQRLRHQPDPAVPPAAVRAATR